MRRDPQARGPGENAPSSEEGPTAATVAPREASKTRALIFALHPMQGKPCA